MLKKYGVIDQTMYFENEKYGQIERERERE